MTHLLLLYCLIDEESGSEGCLLSDLYKQSISEPLSDDISSQ